MKKRFLFLLMLHALFTSTVLGANVEDAYETDSSSPVFSDIGEKDLDYLVFFRERFAKKFQNFVHNRSFHSTEEKLALLCTMSSITYINYLIGNLSWDEGDRNWSPVYREWVRRHKEIHAGYFDWFDYAINLEEYDKWSQAMEESLAAKNGKVVWDLAKSNSLNEAAQRRGYAAKKAAWLREAPILKGIACLYDILIAGKVAMKAANGAWGYVVPDSKITTPKAINLDWANIGQFNWWAANNNLEQRFVEEFTLPFWVDRFTSMDITFLLLKLDFYVVNFDRIFEGTYKAALTNMALKPPSQNNPFNSPRTWALFRDQYFSGLDAGVIKFLPWIDMFNELMLPKNILLFWSGSHDNNNFISMLPKEIFAVIYGIIIDLPNVPRDNRQSHEVLRKHKKQKKGRPCTIQ